MASSKELHIDVAFAGARAITPEFGVTARWDDVTEHIKAIIELAGKPLEDVYEINCSPDKIDVHWHRRNDKGEKYVHRDGPNIGDIAVACTRIQLTRD